MAKEESSEGSSSIIEERVEFMVDHTTSNVIQNPTKRTALFLKPSLNPNALPPSLPRIQSFSSSSEPNVVFLCTSIPLKGWQTWVENLRVTHEPAWRKAGIFDAIKGSTYHIDRVSDLIFSLVERWCPESNTFVFPWGEATITLEDVYVLGGFLPLGASVLSSSSSTLGECSNYSDHCSFHNEEEENEITILCSEAGGSDFAARHHNLAPEVGKFRAMSPLMGPKGGSKKCEVNAREQNIGHNVAEHHVITVLKTSGSMLAEDEPDEALCKDKDPMNQADIPAGSQLTVINDHKPFVALCVQYESRISRLEREFSALLGTTC